MSWVIDMIRYSVVIPAYNEEKSILKLLNEVKETMRRIRKPYEIIVVNDGSTDNTEKIVENIKGIRLINQARNDGYGASLKKGINNSRGEWIIITDADGTYPIKDIPKILKFTNSFEMVIGARVSKNVKMPFMRRPAKWILARISNYITNTKIPDLNSGLRVFRKDMVYHFWGLFPDGFSFTTTLTVAALCSGYSVKYTPIDYFKRKGKSSIHPIKDFIGFVKLLSKIALYFRPLKIFFPASLIILLLGILRGARDLFLTDSLGELSVILVLGSIQILFFGFLAELIVKKGEVPYKAGSYVP